MQLQRDSMTFAARLAAPLALALVLPLGAAAQDSSAVEAIQQFNQDADSQDDVTSVPTGDGEAVQPDPNAPQADSAAGGVTLGSDGSVEDGAIAACDPTEDADCAPAEEED